MNEILFLVRSVYHFNQVQFVWLQKSGVAPYEGKSQVGIIRVSHLFMLVSINPSTRPSIIPPSVIHPSLHLSSTHHPSIRQNTHHFCAGLEGSDLHVSRTAVVTRRTKLDLHSLLLLLLTLQAVGHCLDGSHPLLPEPHKACCQVISMQWCVCI